MRRSAVCVLLAPSSRRACSHHYWLHISQRTFSAPALHALQTPRKTYRGKRWKLTEWRNKEEERRTIDTATPASHLSSLHPALLLPPSSSSTFSSSSLSHLPPVYSSDAIHTFCQTLLLNYSISSLQVVCDHSAEEDGGGVKVSLVVDGVVLVSSIASTESEARERCGQQGLKLINQHKKQQQVERRVMAARQSARHASAASSIAHSYSVFYQSLLLSLRDLKSSLSSLWSCVHADLDSVFPSAIDASRQPRVFTDHQRMRLLNQFYSKKRLSVRRLEEECIEWDVDVEPKGHNEKKSEYIERLISGLSNARRLLLIDWPVAAFFPTGMGGLERQAGDFNPQFDSTRMANILTGSGFVSLKQQRPVALAIKWMHEKHRLSLLEANHTARTILAKHGSYLFTRHSRFGKSLLTMAEQNDLPLGMFTAHLIKLYKREPVSAEICHACDQLSRLVSIHSGEEASLHEYSQEQLKQIRRGEQTLRSLHSQKATGLGYVYSTDWNKRTATHIEADINKQEGETSRNKQAHRVQNEMLTDSPQTTAVKVIKGKRSAVKASVIRDMQTEEQTEELSIIVEPFTQSHQNGDLETITSERERDSDSIIESGSKQTETSQMLIAFQTESTTHESSTGVAPSSQTETRAQTQQEEQSESKQKQLSSPSPSPSVSVSVPESLSPSLSVSSSGAGSLLTLLARARSDLDEDRLCHFFTSQGVRIATELMLKEDKAPNTPDLVFLDDVVIRIRPVDLADTTSQGINKRKPQLVRKLHSLSELLSIPVLSASASGSSSCSPVREEESVPYVDLPLRWLDCKRGDGHGCNAISERYEVNYGRGGFVLLGIAYQSDSLRLDPTLIFDAVHDSFPYPYASKGNNDRKE